MVDMIRNELQRRNIPILCETYDGQWHKHVTENAHSHRLMQLFGCDNWNRISVLTKDKCIEQFSSICVVKNSMHSIIRDRAITCGNQLTVCNLKIEKGSNNELHVSTTDGKMQYVHSVHPLSHPDLYHKSQVDLSYKNYNEYLLCEKKYARKATGEKLTKLRKYKFTSVFSCAAKNDQQKVNTSERDEDLDNINIDDIATNQQNTTLENYLKSGDCPLLENILNELQRKNAQKWESVTLDELFSEYLINGQVLVKETNLKEIAIILLELRCISGRMWHTNDILKAEKVNAIVKAFGGTHFAEVKWCSKKIHNP